MIVEGHEAPSLAVELLGDHLAHVHIKNVSWLREGDHWHYEWEDLETGMVRWKNVIDVLKASGYDGYLSNENLKGLLLPGATGFLGERLSQTGTSMALSAEDKLAHDIKYLKELLSETR
jgi:sugar phosphate isomerase/epimerase